MTFAERRIAFRRWRRVRPFWGGLLLDRVRARTVAERLPRPRIDPGALRLRGLPVLPAARGHGADGRVQLGHPEAAPLLRHHRDAHRRLLAHRPQPRRLVPGHAARHRRWRDGARRVARPHFERADPRRHRGRSRPVRSGVLDGRDRRSQPGHAPGAGGGAPGRRQCEVEFSVPRDSDSGPRPRVGTGAVRRPPGRRRGLPDRPRRRSRAGTHALTLPAPPRRPPSCGASSGTGSSGRNQPTPGPSLVEPTATPGPVPTCTEPAPTSPGAPPSATATDSGAPPAPGATTPGTDGGTAPGPSPSASPSPTVVPAPIIAAAPGQPIVSSRPARMTTSTLTLEGFSFDGVVDLPTANGTIRVLQSPSTGPPIRTSGSWSTATWRSPATHWSRPDG